MLTLWQQRPVCERRRRPKKHNITWDKPVWREAGRLRRMKSNENLVLCRQSLLGHVWWNIKRFVWDFRLACGNSREISEMSIRYSNKQPGRKVDGGQTARKKNTIQVGHCLGLVRFFSLCFAQHLIEYLFYISTAPASWLYIEYCWLFIFFLSFLLCFTLGIYAAKRSVDISKGAINKWSMATT